MPTTLPPLNASPLPDPYPRKRWTRTESRTLVNLGVLEPDRFELIDGDLVPKVSQNPPHVLVVSHLVFALADIFGRDFIQAQAPIALNEENEPEPDVTVTARPLRDYLTLGTPTAAEARLVVEAADATLRGDRTVKAQLYSEAGIEDYWVVDITNRVLVVFRQPGSEGYADIVTYAENETVSPLAAPGAIIRIADLLP